LFKGFEREIFSHPSFSLLYLIHYMGDCTLQVEKPHGNRKKQENLFTKRWSVRQGVKQRLSTK